MAFEQQEFSAEELLAAKALFRQGTKFVLGVAKLEQIPVTDLPEIAFAGRSNVGKSSIINAVTMQRGLAKASNTPGRTQQLNYFILADKMHLVDLPGYGYAQAPEAMVKQWQKLIMTYLQGRVNLKRVFLLIDSRHGIKKVDEEIMEMLDKAAVTYQIVLTKIDKISAKAVEEVLAATQKTVAEHAAAYSTVLCTSSEKNLGIEELQAEVASLISSD